MTRAELRPDQGELVEIARSVFVDELLPLLPEEKRLQGLMVARALAIAGRMTGQVVGDDDEAGILCRDIRAGLYDGDPSGQLRSRLIERTLKRLAVSSPKMLAAAEQTLQVQVPQPDL